MTSSADLSFGLNADAAAKRLERAGRSLSKDLKAGGESVHQLILKAMEQGNRSSADSMRKLAEEASKTLEDASEKVESARRELKEFDERSQAEEARVRASGRKEDLKQLKDKHRKDREAFEKNLKKASEKANYQTAQVNKQLEIQAAKDMARVEEHAKILKEAQEKSAKLTRTRIQEGGEFIGERISGAMSLGIDDLGKALSMGVAKFGTTLSTAATKRMATNAASGKDSGKGLAALAAVGPVLAGMAAVVGGIALLFGAAYSQVKDFNKAILDGNTSLDLFGSAALDAGFNLKSGLKDIRAAAFEVSALTKQSAEDVLGIIKSFNSAGVPLSKLRGAFSETGNALDAYTNMAMFATKYSQTLGVSVDEVATTFSTMFKSMGLGLDTIEGGFQAITAGAAVAGLNVKDFFNTISQTTSGLALYNLRLEDTAKQLAGLTKILGKEKAEEITSGAPEMGNKGIEERFKASMLVGRRGQKIFQTSLEQQLGVYKDTFGETFKEEFADLLDNPAKLAKMTGREFGELQAKLTAAGAAKGDSKKGEAAARNLEAVRKLAQGATGTTMGMAKGMSGLGPLQDLAMRMTEGMSLVGAQSLDDMGFIARKNFEDMTGISGKNFDDMASLLNRYQAAAPEGTSVDELLQRMASGQIPMSEGDRALFDKISETKPETMESLAQKQIDEVKGIGDILKNKIAGLLEGLSDITESIFDGLAAWIDDFGDAKKKKEAKEQSKESIRSNKELLGSLDAQKKEIAKKLEEAYKSGDKSETDRLMGELNGILVQITNAEKNIAFQQDFLNSLASGKSVGSAMNEAWVARGANAQAPAVAAKTTQESYGVLADPITPLKMQEEANATSEEQLALDTQKAVKDEKFQRDSIKKDEKTIETLGKLNKELTKSAALETLSGRFGADVIAGAQTGDAAMLRTIQAAARGNPQLSKIITESGIPLQDFVYRGDGVRGTIQPISTKDEFFGAKPGGAIDKAVNGGQAGVVNIHIHGGNEAQVFNTVKRAIKAAK